MVSVLILPALTILLGPCRCLVDGALLVTLGADVVPASAGYTNPLCKCCHLPVNSTPVKFGVPSNFYLNANDGMVAVTRTLITFFKWINRQRGGICVAGQRRPAEIVFVGMNGSNATVSLATRQLLDSGVKLLFGAEGDEATQWEAQMLQGSDGMIMASAASDTGSFRGTVFTTLRPGALFLIPILTMVRQRATSLVRIMSTHPNSRMICEDGVSDVAWTLKYSFDIFEDIPALGNTATESDFDAIVSNWVDNPNHLVVVCGSFMDAQFCARVIESLKRLDYSPQAVMMIDCTVDNTFAKLAGDSARFILTNSPWYDDLRPMVDANEPMQQLVTGGAAEKTEFVDIYRDEWGDSLHYTAASTWVAGEVYIAAIEATNSDEPRRLVEYVHNPNFFVNETLFGKFIFNSRTGWQDVMEPPLHDVDSGQQVQGGAINQAVCFDSRQPCYGQAVLPLPKWRVRPCMLRAVSGNLNSIWGFYGPSKFYEKDTFLTYTSDNGGTLLKIQPEVLGSAAYFAATILGFNDFISSTLADLVIANATSHSHWGQTYLANLSLAHQWMPSLIGFLDDFIVTLKDSMSLLSVDIARAAEEAYIFSVNKSAPVCVPCPSMMVSEFEESTGSRVCRTCESGISLRTSTYTPPVPIPYSVVDLAMRYCVVDCPLGMWEVASGVCQTCPPGSFGAGSSSCTLCDVGYFSSNYGQSTCSLCHIGDSATSQGQTACDECPPGTASESGRLCRTCSKGTFTNIARQSLCRLCDQGKAIATPGNTACETCGPGTYSVWGGFACAPCESGSYQPNSSAHACIDAPEGTEVAEQNTAITNKEGFWFRYEANVITRVEKCIGSHGCLENEKCNRGSAGVLCNQCVPGYARYVVGSQFQTSCFTCPSFEQNVLLLVVMAITMLVGSFWISKKSVEADSRPLDLTSVFCKLLLTYSIMISVASSAMANVIQKREVLLGPAITIFSEYLSDILSIASGAPIAETPFFSVSCFFQQVINEYRFGHDFEAMAGQFEAMTYKSYGTDESEALLQDVTELMRQAEMATVLFWALWPAVMSIIVFVLSLLYVTIKLTLRMSYYRRALKFYEVMCSQDFDTAVEMAEEEEDENEGGPSWAKFIVEHGVRFHGVWWPVIHADARLRGYPLAFGRFWVETWPVLVTLCLYSYAGVMFGVTRPFRCLYDEGKGESVQFYLTELKCFDLSDKLSQAALASTVFWAVLAPLTCACYLYFKRKSIVSDNLVRARYGIWINGYKIKSYWWEVLVFALKASIILVVVCTSDPEIAIRLLLFIVIVYGGLTVTLKPFDKRCHGAASKVHGHIILIWMMQCILVAFITMVDAQNRTTDQVNGMSYPELSLYVRNRDGYSPDMSYDDLLMVAVDYSYSNSVVHVVLLAVVVVGLQHMLCIAHCSYRIYTFLLESYLVSTTQQRLRSAAKRKGTSYKSRLFAPIQRFFERSSARLHRDAPYVCMDHLLGWVVMCGSHGSDAKKPDIPRSYRFPMGVPKLSDVAGTPDSKVLEASFNQRAWLRSALSSAMSKIYEKLNNSTFSVSRLEFVVRAAFTLAHMKQSGMTDHLKMLSSWADYEICGDCGAAETDIFDIETKDEMHSRLSQIGATGLQRMASTLGKKTLASAGRAPSDLSMRAYLKHAADKVISDELEWRALARGGDTAEGENQGKRKGAMAQYISWFVLYMFHPTVYEMGVEMEVLQLALLELERMNPDTLRDLLDEFEGIWCTHNLFKSHRLRRYSHNIRDSTTQTEKSMRGRMWLEREAGEDEEGPECQESILNDVQWRSKEAQAGSYLNWSLRRDLFSPKRKQSKNVFGADLSSVSLITPNDVKWSGIVMKATHLLHDHRADILGAMKIFKEKEQLSLKKTNDEISQLQKTLLDYELKLQEKKQHVERLKGQRRPLGSSPSEPLTRFAGQERWS